MARAKGLFRTPGRPAREHAAPSEDGVEAIAELEATDFEERLAAVARRRDEAIGSAQRDLVLTGRRREALALLESDPRASSADAARSLSALRTTGPIARLQLDGEDVVVALGEEVTVGRAGASIALASPVVSRRHVVVRRTPAGPEARDGGSRHGTWLRGRRLAAPLPIDGHVDVALGREVPLSLQPWGSGGVVLCVAGRTLHAPLGPLRVGALDVRLAGDGWLEVRAEGPVVLDDLLVSTPIQLCAGDAVREALGGPVRVRVPR